MSKIVAEIFFLIGVVLGGFLFWQLIKGMKSRNWPTVQGRVIDSRMTTHVSRDDDGSRSTTYGAAISYRYDVDGDEYSGDKRSFADYNSSNRGRAEKIVARYAPGTVVPVYYRPDQPDESVLEPGTNVVSFLFLLFPLIFLVLGVLGLLGRL